MTLRRDVMGRDPKAISVAMGGKGILLPRMPIMFTTTSSMAIQMGFIRGCMSVCMNGFMRSPPQARLRPGAMHPYRLSGS